MSFLGGPTITEMPWPEWFKLRVYRWVARAMVRSLPIPTDERVIEWICSGHCPECGYDWSHGDRCGCPECGWCRSEERYE